MTENTPHIMVVDDELSMHEIDQNKIKLKSQHHAGEKAHQHHNLSRFGANIINLLDNIGYGFKPKHHNEGPEEENGHRPHVVV